MIIIDTNVVSQLMRSSPEATVLAWFSGHSADTLFLTSISEAELRTGAAILPAGQRRDRLVGAIDAMIDQDFAGRILPFDSPAARIYAENCGRPPRSRQADHGCRLPDRSDFPCL
jgi:hypothetical protein